MTFRRRGIAGVTAALVVCGLSMVAAARQGAGQPAAPEQGSPPAESVFKNVQVLKGIPVDEFMDVMGMFSAALGYDCSSCHSSKISSDRSAFALVTPNIQRARQMMLMTNALNRANFAGVQRVSCFTCHRGHYRPEIVPDLALQYGELRDDPNSMVIFPDRQTAAPQVFDKYIRALGGADRLAALRSFAATGTYAGFNTGGADLPVEIVARAPGQISQVVRAPDSVSVKTYDGRNAWAAEGWRPLPLMTFSGSNLSGAKVDAVLAFPAGLQKAFSQWQVSSATIDDETVQILQGSNPGELPVNFYFDGEGLLVRQVRWNRTAAGTVPVQVDYSDYRDVAGVKMPFKTIVTWTDGQNTIDLKEIRPNVAIDAARFARPAPFTRR
jgi:hypothetical protein